VKSVGLVRILVLQRYLEETNQDLEVAHRALVLLTNGERDYSVYFKNQKPGFGHRHQTPVTIGLQILIYFPVRTN